MATLPTPGGDSNTWGTELNEWLLVGHDESGNNFGAGGGDTVLFDQELSSPSATFDATGLSQDYDHLRIVLLSRGTHSAEDVQIRLRFNGDTGSNYEFVHSIDWAADARVSAEAIAQGFIRLGSSSAAVSDAGIYVSTIADIPFYTSGAHKTLHYDQVSKNDGGTNGMYLFTGIGSWIDTDPITQITLHMDNGNFDTGSRLMIYGVGGEGEAATIDASDITAEPLPSVPGFVQSFADGQAFADDTLEITVPAGGVAEGNTLVVLAQLHEGPPTGTASITDESGNTYTSVVSRVGSGGHNYRYFQMFVAPITTALDPGDIITVEASLGSGPGIYAIVSEFQGLLNADLVDQVATDEGVSTSVSSGLTATTDQASELIVGGHWFQGVVTWTPDTDFEVAYHDVIDGSAYGLMQYKTVSSTDEYESSGTAGSGVNNWNMVVALRIDPAPMTDVQTRLDELQDDVDHKPVQLQVTDANGDAIETGDGQGWFWIPPEFDGWNLVSVTGAVTTVSSSGPVTVQIRNETQSNVNMLTTPLTVDASERTSATAAAAVVDAANDDVATGDFLFVDIDAAGTGAKGLIVVLTFEAP